MDADVREQIVTLLRGTGRIGMDEMIEELDTEGFFTSPASTRFHGAHEGGLATHSLGVYHLLSTYHKQFPLTPNFGAIVLPVEEKNLIIAALLHDICKVGAYIPQTGKASPYRWNRAQPGGHALLSLVRITKHIKMEEIEELMIKFHMGIYGSIEFNAGSKYNKGEYSLTGVPGATKEDRYGKSLRNAWYHNSVIKLIYIYDEFETFGG